MEPRRLTQCWTDLGERDAFRLMRLSGSIL
jgi:hypothetical protein